MAGMCRMNGKPLGANGAHAPARLRRAAMHASVCTYGQAAVAEQGTWFVTVGIDGWLEGPEGDETG
jgi:hypothetical protein